MKLNKPTVNMGKAGPKKDKKPQKPAGGRKSAKGNNKEKPRRGGRFILLIGDEGAILTFIQGGKVTRRLFVPSPQQEHVHTMVDLMASHPSATVYVLVDMIDQSYVRHTLPPVSPLSVNKLVQRRLERDFAAEDITGALNLGREKTGRKEWNFLLISLAYNVLLQQWLEVVLELPNHFKGLYLVPVEGQDYILQMAKALQEKDDAKAQWQILVSHDKVGGFRQVVLRDERLIFTRLTQSMGDVMPEVMAGSVEQEVQNTIEYLRRLSYDERHGLEIFVVVAQEIKDAIDSNKLKAQRVHLLTPFEVANALGQEQSALSGDRFGDVVLATAFGQRRKHRLKLMSKQAAGIEKLYMAKAALRGVAALAAAGLIYMMAMNGLGAFNAQSELGKLESQKGQKQQELETAQLNLEKLGNDVNMLMSVATLYQDTKPDNPNFLEFVRRFGQLTDEKALVKSIKWARGMSASVEQGGSEMAVGNEGAPQGGDTIDTSESFTARVDMEFIKHEGDQQKLVEDVSAFLTKLQDEFEGYEVTHEKLAGITGEDEKLELNFDDMAAQDGGVDEGDNIVSLTIKGPIDPATQVPADPGMGM